MGDIADYYIDRMIYEGPQTDNREGDIHMTTTTKVVTGEVRLSYTHLFEAHAMEEGQKKKYSTAILIPKSDKATLTKIKKAIDAAIEAGKSKLEKNGKIPATIKKPLRDGDEERPDDDAYVGHFFLNASSDQRPGVVDQSLNKVIDPEEVYSGCYGRVSLNFYAFNTSGNKGIAAGLNNVQKLRDGEALSGRSRAEDDFDAVETDEEEDDFLS